ncbi:hypothetical protein EYC58_01220 [Candidatus Saccharibacteria bacterium]|nr:MAG: hypothetical protein EYC58_01220 [Candidatus Saccharibacteria bacterium]
MATKTEKQMTRRLFMYLSMIGAIILLAIAGLAWWAHSFIGTMVSTELAAQKVYFPEKGSPALDPTAYPDLQQYAGQLVDTPEKAKAYANGYIGRHLQKVADGKVYAEVSAEAMKDPTNTKLQQQKASLFQGETLRGILLTSGYGFGTIGKVAGIAAVVALGTAIVLAVIAGVLRVRM